MKSCARAALLLGVLALAAASAYLFLSSHHEVFSCCLASLAGLCSWRAQRQGCDTNPQALSAPGATESSAPHASLPLARRRWRTVLHALRFVTVLQRSARGSASGATLQREETKGGAARLRWRRLLGTLRCVAALQTSAPALTRRRDGEGTEEADAVALDADYLLRKSRGELRRRRARLHDARRRGARPQDERHSTRVPRATDAARTRGTLESPVALEHWTLVEYRHAMAFVLKRRDVARLRGCLDQALPQEEGRQIVKDFVGQSISEESASPGTLSLARAVEDGSVDLAGVLVGAPQAAPGPLLHALWSRIYAEEASLLKKCHADAARPLVAGVITQASLREAARAATRRGGGGIQKSARATQRGQRALQAPPDLQERRGSYNAQTRATLDARVSRCRRARNVEERRREAPVAPAGLIRRP